VKTALVTLRDKLANVEWNKAAINAAIKETIAVHGLKMPQLAHAVRVLVCGRPQTPSIDAVLELFERDIVLSRLRSV
jgi:glutamyl-tRNA synthetase